MGDIYIIKNSINNKVYIGQTIHGAAHRFQQHITGALRGDESCPALYRAMRKYGVENFYYEILELNVPNEKLDELEISYIKQYDSYHNGYNATTGGSGKLYAEIENEGWILWMSQIGIPNRIIADTLEIPIHRVRLHLKKCGFKTPDVIPSIVLRCVNEGYTTKQIHEEFGISIGRIRKIRRDNNCREIKNAPIEQRINTTNLINDYLSGMSKKNIRLKYNISDTPLERLIHQYELEHIRDNKIMLQIDSDMVVTDYYLGMSRKDMAIKYRISEPNILKILADRNVWITPTILHNGGKIYYGRMMNSRTQNRMYGYGIVSIPMVKRMEEQ